MKLSLTALRLMFRPKASPIAVPAAQAATVLDDSKLHEGIKPPADPAADGWAWNDWANEIAGNRWPGWSYCRFAHRTSPRSGNRNEERATFVFGMVRGAFGLWKKPMTVTVYNPDGAPVDVVDDNLTCVTHLRSGMGFGVFAERETAAKACELAERIAPDFEFIDYGDAAWAVATQRTFRAWFDLGLRYSINVTAADKEGCTYDIIGMSPESAMEGKPEKLS